MIDVQGLSLTTAARLIGAKEHTSVEITQAYLDRIARYNPKLNAYLEVFEEDALADAKRADKEVSDGVVRGPLHGVPIAAKDIIDVRGRRTTAGGVLLPDGPAKADAEVIARLRAAGAVFLGKLNLHEYAWGGTTDNPHYGRCFNPWKDGHSPGGSSGGSGTAVAACLCAAALGTDTLGSVRIPSSYCGCVGVKPTAGRVSNRGVYPLSWSLDNVGPLARSVEDANTLLDVMAGYDPDDPYSAERPYESSKLPNEPDVSGMRIGVATSWIHDAGSNPAEKEVAEAFDLAVAALVDRGCKRVEVDGRDLAQATQVGITITLADAAIHEEHLEKDPDKIGADVRGLLEAGAALSGTAVAEAHRSRVAIRHAVTRIMEQVDCLVTPTTPAPAHAFSNSRSAGVAKFTAAFNTLGYPAVSLPCGFTESGLPIGLMVSASPFEENRVLTVARAYEASTNWMERFPPGFD